MSDKLSISYHTAKRILLELLENNDFSAKEVSDLFNGALDAIRHISD